ncbi:MAG: TIGR04283 family arsenosugar biosynthesis glycosyltransferase [Oleiphilaceae bacterium]|nr:TIGR04283 family arsenosugar biosynthesis glycosyltransferase [Oleiphilaceae bacterium]
MSKCQLSVIVPVLNEEAGISALIHALCKQMTLEQELLLVDGGSSDGTWQRIQHIKSQYSDKTVISLQSPPGRARQMNAGAARARGDRLLFLHADSRIEPGLLASLCAPWQRCWGRFDIYLDASAKVFRLIETLINLRSRLSGIATGDQGLFVEREVFEAVGGFPAQPLMEDIELSKRLKRHSRPWCIRQPKLGTSARKWQQEGVWRTIWLMWRLRAAYALGAKPEKLVEAYYQKRNA